MSGSELLAAESSKGKYDMKMGPPWNKIRIRLPPRKRMSNDLLRLSNEVPHDANNSPSKTVPEQTIDMLCENLTSTLVRGEASNSSPRKGMCSEYSNTFNKALPDDSNSDASTNKLPEEANDNNLNNSPLTTSVSQENYASISYAKKTYEETNNNILIKALLIPTKELPQNSVDNIPNKNLMTTGVLGDEENYNSPRETLIYETDCNIPCKIVVPEEAKISCKIVVPEETKNNRKRNLATAEVKGEARSSSARKGFCNESNRNILSDTLPDEANVDTSTDKVPEEASESNLNKNLLDTSVAQENYTSISSAKKTCEEASINILSNALLMHTKESPQKSVDNVPIKNLITTGMLGEEENFNSQRKRLLYENNCNVPCKLAVAEETKNNRKWKLATTASMCEEAKNDPLSKRFVVETNNEIPTTKMSGKAESNGPSNRTVDPGKKNTLRKKLHTSIATSQKTSQMKLSTSVGQSAEPRSNAAKLKVIQEYKEFEEEVKRTIYLDQFSHQCTEAVITTALHQFGTVRKVSFVVNYTIPFDIPQSALVEMESEKDAECVVNMLQDFPFMMSGTPRPVRAKRATAEMFRDRPRRPDTKFEFRWVGPKDRDYETMKKLKALSKKHELENLALIKHELQEEQFLAKYQEESLNCQYMKLQSVDSVVTTGQVDHLLSMFSMNMNRGF